MQTKNNIKWEKHLLVWMKELSYGTKPLETFSLNWNFFACFSFQMILFDEKCFTWPRTFTNGIPFHHKQFIQCLIGRQFVGKMWWQIVWERNFLLTIIFLPTNIFLPNVLDYFDHFSYETECLDAKFWFYGLFFLTENLTKTEGNAMISLVFYCVSSLNLSKNPTLYSNNTPVSQTR